MGDEPIPTRIAEAIRRLDRLRPSDPFRAYRIGQGNDSGLHQQNDSSHNSANPITSTNASHTQCRRLTPSTATHTMPINGGRRTIV